ncbi:MAG: hypothetical protein IH614_19190 [Desulfuromonadales bacterium]|nr:hypothetical protein [Desulfuromonadales bacterium]
MEAKKVDLIIQYVLALASQLDEWTERNLGPIHFIKYVYLADLAYAKRKHTSFTGVAWRFHKFGPWSNDVFQRLDGALEAIGADKKLIPSRYSEEDYARWSVSRTDLIKDLEKDIPLSIYLELQSDVKRFSNDTASLLHHVYQTLPMLTAAPGEDLNLFAEAHFVEDPEKEIAAAGLVQKEQISNNEKRRRQAKAKELKAKINEKIAARIKQKEEARRSHKPEYNEVFSRGVEWLDSLAGQPIAEFEGIAEIAPTLWKSPARFDPDVS